MSSAKATIGAIASTAMMLGAVATNYQTPAVPEPQRAPTAKAAAPIKITGGREAKTVAQAVAIVRTIALQTGYAVADDADYGVVMLQQHARGWNLTFLLRGSERAHMARFVQSWIAQLFPQVRAMPPPRQGQDGSITFEFRTQHFRSQ